MLDEHHIQRERKKARDLKCTSWWKQLVAQGNCYYCGKNVISSEITMDHKIPVSRGGKTTKGNVVACCKPCNNNKKWKTPAELLLEAMDTGFRS